MRIHWSALAAYAPNPDCRSSADPYRLSSHSPPQALLPGKPAWVDCSRSLQAVVELSPGEPWQARGIQGTLPVPWVCLRAAHQMKVSTQCGAVLCIWEAAACLVLWASKWQPPAVQPQADVSPRWLLIPWQSCRSGPSTSTVLYYLGFSASSLPRLGPQLTHPPSDCPYLS